jgi:hypothetical protein
MANERIHQEMRDADQIRDNMKQNILDRAKTILGDGYDKGMSALNDIYRRCIENAYYGKDIFDGRFQSDSQQLGTDYDQRAQFYGLDKAQDQEQDRGEDLEH